MWKSCVYKITVGEETYVGSTYDLKNRLRGHKSSCYNPESKEYNYKIYKYIREHSHWDNVNVEVLVHLHPKFNKVERCSFEQEWIDYINPTLNKWSSNTGLSKNEYKKNGILIIKIKKNNGVLIIKKKLVNKEKSIIIIIKLKLVKNKNNFTTIIKIEFLKELNNITLIIKIN